MDMDETVLVCRCEGVSWTQVEEAARIYRPGSLRELKLLTRLGMGICQGRTCRPLAEAVARALGIPGDDDGLAYRPPYRPVRMDMLSGGPDAS
jgi:bacterioferritin-associated ferredoxin